MLFAEKVALVTGAGSGIGKATALALARHGDMPGAMGKYAAAHERSVNWAEPLKA